ncbi:MAG: hypothetical protein GTO16_00150 [Candidatus Aminicenantes bacterium]|nr:hypothetical protein [Candidatus Aminicenantes bacterium]
MSLAVENVAQRRKEKKENYSPSFPKPLKSAPPSLLISILCHPSLNSWTVWNKALNYPAIGKKT